jgi:DNA-binding LacI/PurR family transcriptional regulator
MKKLKLLQFHEQLAGHLREEIMRGVWAGQMPGAPTLAGELGVDHRMVIAAFGLLEKDGLLAPQGAGRRRKIVSPENHTPPALRVRILPYEKKDRNLYYVLDLLHRLMEMGHLASLSSKTLKEMGMNVENVARFVQKNDADAWIVMSGSREILEWFAKRSEPAFAFAGRWRGVPIAASSPDKAPELRKAVRRLFELGHRRIVLLNREERRKPGPAFLEREFLTELESLGIQTGPYNMPDWRDNMNDFHRRIDSLFRHTPPTAMVIDEMPLFIAAQQHLAHSGYIAPRDVSLACLDPDYAFDWCQPSVAHIHWSPELLVRRITRWADNVARGKEDRRQSFSNAEFVEGGTIGPVPESRDTGIS